jgi:hypothetical protein
MACYLLSVLVTVVILANLTGWPGYWAFLLVERGRAVKPSHSSGLLPLSERWLYFLAAGLLSAVAPCFPAALAGFVLWLFRRPLNQRLWRRPLTLAWQVGALFSYNVL